MIVIQRTGLQDDPSVHNGMATVHLQSDGDKMRSLNHADVRETRRDGTMGVDRIG